MRFKSTGGLIYQSDIFGYLKRSDYLNLISAQRLEDFKKCVTTFSRYVFVREIKALNSDYQINVLNISRDPITAYTRMKYTVCCNTFLLSGFQSLNFIIIITGLSSIDNSSMNSFKSSFFSGYFASDSFKYSGVSICFMFIASTK